MSLHFTVLDDLRQHLYVIMLLRVTIKPNIVILDLADTPSSFADIFLCELYLTSSISSSSVSVI